MKNLRTVNLISGHDLRVGDTIETWWGRDTITALRPYTGSIRELWNGEAKSAYFALNKIGMTIEPQMTFTVRNRTR